DLLMEPVATHDLTSNVDLTRDALVDMGWSLGTGIPCPLPEGEGPQSLARLGNAYPNPFGRTFGPNATVQWDLVTAGDLDVTVYDLGGRLVKHLVSGFRSPGLGQAT